MKDTLLTILRNKKTSTMDYRSAANRFAYILAVEVSEHFEKAKIAIETPIASTEGVEFINKLTLIPILRSGLALLHPFLTCFPDAQVGFIGVKRDEQTAKPELYYQNIPFIPSNHSIVLLEPMIATAGSILAAIDLLLKRGVKPSQITIASIIASKWGKETLEKEMPEIRLTIGAVDESLTHQKFILPGLGDFGDRYFDTKMD